MSDLAAILAANRVAADDLLAAAEACAAAWTQPRAPGKWSPAQIVEHVALALEESARAVAGEPSKFRSFGPLRPVARMMFYNRVLKRGAFMNARTSPAMNPASGPASAAAARDRIAAALAAFDAACRAAGSTFTHPIFGTITVDSYARFQELHTRHHTRQMPVAVQAAG